MINERKKISKYIRTSYEPKPSDPRLSIERETEVQYGRGRTQYEYTTFRLNLPFCYKVEKTHFLDSRIDLVPRDRQKEDWIATASNLVFECSTGIVEECYQVYSLGKVLVEVNKSPVWKYEGSLLFCGGGSVRNNILSADLISDFNESFVQGVFFGKDGEQAYHIENSTKEVLKPLSAKICSLALKCEGLLYTLQSTELLGGK